MPLWRIIQTVINLAGVRFGGAAIGLMTQVLLAHLLAPRDVGVVFMAMSAASIISLVATLGYPALILTSTARYLALGRATLLDALKASATRDTLAMGGMVLLAVVLLLAFAPFEPRIKTAVLFGALAAPASALMRLDSALANSHRRFALSYVPDFLFRPGLLLLFLAASWFLGASLSVDHVLWAFVAAAVMVALGQAAILGRQGILPEVKPLRHGIAGPLRGRALSLAIVFAVTAAFADLVTLIGGLYLPPGDVAVLGIAIRLAALAGFITQAAQQLVLPDLALAVARQPRQEVEQLLLRVGAIALGAILICVAGTAVAGHWLLGLFGEHYAAGYWPLLLLMAGQTVRAGSGLNQHLLSIHGHQARTAVPCVFAVAVLMAAASLLAPRHGVSGVAVAAILADAVWAALLAVQARRFAGYRGDLVGLLQAR